MVGDQIAESALNNNLVNQNPTKVKAKLRFEGRTFKSSIKLQIYLDLYNQGLKDRQSLNITIKLFLAL